MAHMAVGRRPNLEVLGNDYIQVVELAEGRLRDPGALDPRTDEQVWNLGSGQGYSVLGMVRALLAAIGRSVPYRNLLRRLSHTATPDSVPSKAERDLDWKAKRGLT